MTSKYLVYGLIDPRNHELFYVGKSCSGLEKAQRHTQPWSLRDSNPAKCAKIREILDAGFKPSIVVLRYCRNKYELQRAETVLICTLSRSNSLLNDKLNRRRSWQSSTSNQQKTISEPATCVCH